MSTKLWMLDTNTISYLIRYKDTTIQRKLDEQDINSICISTVTEAELLYGVAKKPEATQLKQLVDAFLVRVNCLPWNSNVAKTYAQLRASLESNGLSLGNLDMMIAAHAIAIEATLVTSDKAFRHIDNLTNLEDWRDGS